VYDGARREPELACPRTGRVIVGLRNTGTNVLVRRSERPLRKDDKCNDRARRRTEEFEGLYSASRSTIRKDV
jgi:hypothetical protein